MNEGISLIDSSIIILYLAGILIVGIMSVRLKKMTSEGYFLAGLIAKLENDPAEAIKRFQESLYINSSCWLSHFHLAEIHRSTADTKKAIFEYQSVIRYIEGHGADIQGPAFPYISFTAGQIRHLCDYNIAQLRRDIKLKSSRQKRLS